MNAKSVVVCFSLFLASCTSPDRLDLMASDGQQSLIRDGSQALISAKHNIVMIKPVSSTVEGGARPAFAVLIANMGTERIEFDPVMIRASISKQDGVVVPLKVFSYEELVAEEKRRQNMQAFAVALGAIGNSMQAANAGYSHTNGSFGVTSYNGYNASGTFSATTYDSYRAFNAQQLANAQSAESFSEIRRVGEENLNQLGGAIMKRDTILPGERYGGTIVLDEPKKEKDGSVKYLITVEIAGESHVFTVRQTKA